MSKASKTKGKTRGKVEKLNHQLSDLKTSQNHLKQLNTLLKKQTSTHKQVEEDLRQEFTLHESLLDNLPCIALILKKETREIIVSNEAARKVGAVPGKKCYQAFANRDDACPFCLATKLWATNESQQKDVEYQGKYYKGIWVPLNDKLYVHYIFDITEQKQAEKEKENFVNRLDEKNADLESIINIISHDLRSPLTTANGFGKILGEQCEQLKELICNEKINPEVRSSLENIFANDIPESLGFISESIRKIDSLLETLIKLARLGKSAIKYENLKMDDILYEIQQTLAYQLKKEIITINLQPLPDCIGDIFQITQVFTNLINNSIKYRSTDKQCLITISGYTDNNNSIYCVQDNGIGIDAKYHEKIFEIFYRLNAHDNIGGEGMGLSIIKRILDHNNGTIWIESKPGQGSKFYIALPKG